MAVQAPDSPPAHAIPLQGPGGLSSAHTIPLQGPEGLSPLPGPSTIYAHPSDAPQIPKEDPALRQDPDFRDTHDDPLVTTPEIEALIASHQHLSPGLPLSSWFNDFDQHWPNGPLDGVSEFPDNNQSYTNNGSYQGWSINSPAVRSELPYNTRSHTNNGIEQFRSNDPVPPSIGSSPPATQPRRRKRAHSSPPPPPSGSSTKRRKSMSKDVQNAPRKDPEKTKRSFQCVFRRVQDKLGLKYTCTGAPATTVSAVRTHLTRPLPNQKSPHLPFLKLCKTCNEDILDEYEFNTFHGADGLKCKNPRPQRKGDAGQQEQYELLCYKVETLLSAQTTTESEQSPGAKEALDQNFPSLDRAALTGGDPNGSSDVAKAALQLPRQRHDVDLVYLHGLPSTRRTPSSVRSPENPTSSPSSNSKFAVPYHIPYDVSLVQNMSREEPMVIDDHTDHDDLMLIGFDVHDCRDTIVPANHQATLKNVPSSSGISLPPIRQLFDHSMEPQDATDRWGYLPRHMKYPSALPSLSPTYDTPPHYYTTPCTSSTMTSISEPDSDLTSTVGSYNYTQEIDWSLFRDEPSSSAPPEFGFHNHRTNYVEPEDIAEPEEMHDYASRPSDQVDDAIEACDKCGKVFRGRYRKGNLKRHNTAFHSPLALVGSACRICKKAYKRTDATRKHEWKKHRLLDAMPKKRIQ